MEVTADDINITVAKRGRNFNVRITDEEYMMIQEMQDKSLPKDERVNMSDMLRRCIGIIYNKWNNVNKNYQQPECEENLLTTEESTYVSQEECEENLLTTEDDSKMIAVDPKQEKKELNKKLYGELITKITKSKIYNVKVCKDPSSNGITKFNLTRGDGDTRRVWIFKNMNMDVLEDDIIPVYLDSSNYEQDEQLIMKWVKGEDKILESIKSNS